MTGHCPHAFAAGSDLCLLGCGVQLVQATAGKVLVDPERPTLVATVEPGGSVVLVIRTPDTTP